ncbi:hypothetical protein GGI07_000787 [Coemansia sp. Benny D115]|nr:hypothetical protein GGI07_000787 [Coemansia sp. Benny D115]
MSVVSYSESGWDTQEDDRWDDWEDDEMAIPMKCLFCTHTFQSATVLFRHIKQHHGFDFLQTRSKLKLDFYQSMRVVNYIRTLGLADENFANVAEFRLEGTEDFINDDKYLKPVIEDDTLLYALDELDLDDDFSEEDVEKKNKDDCGSEREKELLSRIRALEQQLEIRTSEVQALGAQFGEYRHMVKRQFYDTIEDDGKSNISAAPHASGDPGNYYFNSYAGNGIHREMLRDTVRTEGYRDFIYDCAESVFRDKVVLDVGCGTGILSMFAARAGAKRVIGVDNSDIIHRARANVAENGLDGVITLVKGRIEDLELPVAQVDVIVSEWMGYFLLFEAMLDSVLVARDRFLAPGGLLAPSASYIYLTAVDQQALEDTDAAFWDDVYGFKMTAMKQDHKPKEATATLVSEAEVEVVPQESVMASRALIASIDHGTTTAAALDFASDFCIDITRSTELRAFLGYFDVAFAPTQDQPGPGSEQLGAPASPDNRQSLWQQPESSMHGFTTGPHGTPTHWKQTLFTLQHPLDTKQGDQVRGHFVCRKSTENPRELDLEITFRHIPKDQVHQDIAWIEANIPAKHEKYELR